MDEKRLMRQLKQCLPDFVNQVDPIQILPYLFCLSQPSKEEIRATQNNKGKTVAAQDLYSHIIRYQERGIKELLEALRDEDIGLKDLADRIDPPSTKDNTATTVQKKTVQKDIVTGSGDHEKDIVRGPGDHEKDIVRGPGDHEKDIVRGPGDHEKDIVRGPGDHEKDIVRGPGDHEKDIVRGPSDHEKKIFDKDTPLRHLPGSVYRVLRLLDSNDQIENWESLAGRIVEYTIEDISRFRQNPHDGSPMIAMYNDWMTREGSTLGHLMQILTKMGRVDVLTEMTKITGYQYQEDNGEQTDGNNYPPEVVYRRIPGPGNPMENMGPIHLDPIHNQGNRKERKDLPAPEQHLGRDPCGPGEDNSVKNGGNKNPNEELDKRFSRPINPMETAGPIPLSPRQGKENSVVEKRELDLPGPEQCVGRGGSGSGEGIDKNANDLMNKDTVKENSVESTERSSKVHSYEKDTEDVICLELKTNVEKVIVGTLEEQKKKDEHDLENPSTSTESEESNSRVDSSFSNHTEDVICLEVKKNVEKVIVRTLEEQQKKDEHDLENPSTSTESEESNSRVDSSFSNHNLQADLRNNYKEFHKEKHHNKDVLTSEIKKEEENNIHKVEKQDYKNDVEQQPDQKVHVETPSYEMVPSPNDSSSSIMSEEENTSGDSKQMNERKKYTGETMGEGQYVPVPTERVSMETNKPMTSTLEFQVCQKGKRFPDEHVIEREQEPSTTKKFTNDTIGQMSVGQDGKQRPKTILNEQMAGIKEGQTTSSLLPEEHQGFDSLGFVPMTIEGDHFVAHQGSTFSHEIDTISHQDNASSQQSKGVSHQDTEEVNLHAQQDIVHAELVDIPAAQKDTNVKRDNGFQAMDDIQVVQSSSVQGGNSSEQQNDSGCIPSSAQRSVNYVEYLIIGLVVVIGAYFVVRRMKKSS